MEENIAKISEQAALFEVNVPDFRGVKMCRKEIKMIKVSETRTLAKILPRYRFSKTMNHRKRSRALLMQSSAQRGVESRNTSWSFFLMKRKWKIVVGTLRKHTFVCIFVQQLWDYVNVVQSSLDEWKTTPWREIEVDNMDMECKKFGKELRSE